MPSLPTTDEDIFNQFGVSPKDYYYDASSNTIKIKPQSEKQSLPTDYDIDPLTGNPIYATTQDASVAPAFLKKLTGTGGEERYQTWPERMVRSGFSLPADVYSGEVPIESTMGLPGTVPAGSNDVNMEPNIIGRALGVGNFTLPNPNSEIGRSLDTAGLAGLGGLSVGSVDASLGSAPFLRPALKYQGKIYKGNVGDSHPVPEALRSDFEQKALSGEDLTDYNFGFINHKGQFLSRENALDYAIKEGLLPPEMGRYGALTTTMLNENRMGTAVAANKPFYSTLENTIASSKMNKATPEQWQGYLRNNGVKPEELEFSGLDQLKGPVTKEQLLQHVQENGIKLGEVWKDGDFEPTKYSQYTLLGGENYRELLLTVPDKYQGRIDQIQKEIGDLFGRKPRGEVRFATPEDENLFGQLSNEQADLIRKQAADRAYQSSHWDEPNVLAHIRMNDRIVGGEIKPVELTAKLNDTGYWKVDNAKTGANIGYISPDVGVKTPAEAIKAWRENGNVPKENIGGLKTLHIEEIQSDWHQAGRKQGYKSAESEAEYIRLNAELQKAQEAVSRRAGELSSKITEKDLEGDSFYPINDFYNKDPVYRELKAKADELEAQRSKVHPVNLVPNAPFKKTWDELAFKRALKEAVDNGYDAVSWTPGEAQAARYQLNNHLKELQYFKNEDGTYELGGTKVNGEGFNYPDKIKPEKLPDIVGKEIAQKIINDEGKRYRGRNGGTLEGVDLKIGGQGMKGFYDKMLVDKANALVKKMGGKVEYEEIRTSQRIKGGKTEKVPFIRITPQMREKIGKEGFPLFSAGVPTFDPVDNNNPFEKKKPRLVPVEGNPFAPKLTPVDFNPFTRDVKPGEVI